MKRAISVLLAIVLLCCVCSSSALAANGVKTHEHTLDEGTVTQEPTCFNRGWITYTCTDPDCSYVYREAIPATGHNMSEGEYLVKPSCSGLGEMIYRCQNPGCSYVTTHIVPYLGHRMEMSEVLSEPTCTHAGLTVFCVRPGGLPRLHHHQFPRAGSPAGERCRHCGTHLYLLRHDGVLLHPGGLRLYPHPVDRPPGPHLGRGHRYH